MNIPTPSPLSLLIVMRSHGEVESIMDPESQPTTKNAHYLVPDLLPNVDNTFLKR